MKSIVSIIIPTHRRPLLLKRLLNTLTAQPDRLLVDIYVVHDGELCQCEIQEKYRSCEKHLSWERSRGPAAARNIGIQTANSEWYALLDDDCLPAEDYLSKLISFCQSANSGVYAGAIEGLGGMSAIGVYQKRTALLESHWSEGELMAAFAPTANLLIHKNIFAQIGLFNEDFRVPGGEDNFFCLKLLIAGIVIRSVDSIRVFHENECSLVDFIKRYYFYGRGFSRFLDQAKYLPNSSASNEAILKMSQGLEIYCHIYIDLVRSMPKIFSEARKTRQKYMMSLKTFKDFKFYVLSLLAEMAYQVGAIVEQTQHEDRENAITSEFKSQER